MKVPANVLLELSNGDLVIVVSGTYRAVFYCAEADEGGNI